MISYYRIAGLEYRRPTSYQDAKAKEKRRKNGEWHKRPAMASGRRMVMFDEASFAPKPRLLCIVHVLCSVFDQSTGALGSLVMRNKSIYRQKNQSIKPKANQKVFKEAQASAIAITGSSRAVSIICLDNIKRSSKPPARRAIKRADTGRSWIA